MPSLNQPPEPDQLEVSIFGPGVGECVVVHLGNSHWVVVDSCVECRSKRPIALEYLEGLGLDPASAIKLIVVSHWHDDHIAGIAEILGIAKSAKVVCSAALRRADFFTLVASAERAMMESPGTAEFLRILKTLEERAPNGSRVGSVAPLWAIANSLLLRLEPPVVPLSTEVQALSPSHGALSLAFQEIGQEFPKLGAVKRRTVAQSPNQVAIVVWMRIGDMRILLGSDLEEGKSPTLGWQAILASDLRDGGLADVFKVPHHGSKNADSPTVWTKVVKQDPIAVITPYASGATPLPTLDDISRLKRRTSRAYVTAPPTGWSPPRRSNSVERTVSEVVRNRRVILGQMGHVRIRVHTTSLTSPRVDLFGTAQRL